MIFLSEVKPIFGHFNLHRKHGNEFERLARQGRAKLWESNANLETKELENLATIIVGPANELMARFHDRTPVVLDWRDVGAWLAGDAPSAAELLRAPPEGALQEWIVAPRVNRAGIGDDDASLIAPA